MNSFNSECNISKPLLLNCWKHHAGFVRSKVKKYRRSPDKYLETLLDEILFIGESLMDLYTGELNPGQVAGSILNYSRQQKIADLNDFTKWLKDEGTDYRILQIGDRSKWTLRLGRIEGRYIHIHPARYSPHTIRIRSSSLKSAILFRVLENQYTSSTLTAVNSVRKDYLNLPPIKSLKKGSALLNLIRLLS